jgi:hypothetical protein
MLFPNTLYLKGIKNAVILYKPCFRDQDTISYLRGEFKFTRNFAPGGKKLASKEMTFFDNVNVLHSRL